MGIMPLIWFKWLVASNTTKTTMRNSKYTMIYCDFKDHKMFHYVRLVVLETNKFPHGISMGGNHFETKEEAESFADDVDEYLEAAFGKKSRKK